MHHRAGNDRQERVTVDIQADAPHSPPCAPCWGASPGITISPGTSRVLTCSREALAHPSTAHLTAYTVYHMATQAHSTHATMCYCASCKVHGNGVYHTLHMALLGAARYAPYWGYCEPQGGGLHARPHPRVLSVLPASCASTCSPAPGAAGNCPQAGPRPSRPSLRRHMRQGARTGHT